MSMIGVFVPLEPRQLEELKANPEMTLGLAFGDAGAAPPMDIDKAWHGIHYLLTGSADGGAPPYSLAILGGEEIGEDGGYGPPRFLTPAEVAQVAQALSALPAQTLAQRYDPAALSAADIYPGGWEDDPDGLKYLLGYYGQLVDLYAQAAANKHAMLLCIT